MSFLFTIVLLAVAGYVLFSAITGKGKLFAVDNIKDDKIPQFKKLLRPIYGVLGGIMLLMALLSAYQNIVFAENTYAFADDFRTYFADKIDKDGNIEGIDANVNTVYSYSKMSSFFSSLEAPEVPEGVAPNYAEAVRDENGELVFVGLGEQTVGQNAVFTKLRTIIPYKLTQILTWVFMGLAILVVVGVFILMHRFTDKEKFEKAKQKRASGGDEMPSSAFDFSEEEEK